MTFEIVDIKINEEYRQLAPELSELEFQSLKESIKTSGLHYAIAVNKDNILLDGHHRYRACQELNIQPKIEVKEIAKQNSLANLKNGNNFPPSRSNELVGEVAVNVAKSVSLSTATYKRAKFIIENGTEHQKQMLQKGRSEIHTIYKQIKNEHIRQEKIRSAKEDTTLLLSSEGIDLRYGDFREKLKDLPDNSIDLIFTDPPYDKESLSLYGELSKLAARVLKEGSSLVVYAPHYYLPQVFEIMKNDKLDYWWIMAVKHNGTSARMHGKQVFVGWKPLLWFVKGKKLASPEYITDFVQPIESKQPEKNEHPWQQAIQEAEYIISRLSVKNQIVLDPFMGSGTTGIAALKLNRKFIGIEIDEDNYNIAKGRIAKFLQQRP
jgi:site-specific DNA-methyltransferase (adenine-specific)